MPILKFADYNYNYTLISNDILRNPNITLESKGLLCYMLSCDKDWKFSIKGLSKVLNVTEHKIRKCLTELEGLGYHKKEVIRDENGRISEWKCYIADTPKFLGQTSDAEPVEMNGRGKYQKCVEVIQEEIKDVDVRNKLYEYLNFWIHNANGSADTFRSIVKKLFTLADTKSQAIDIINQSIDCKYRSFFPKKEYRKKNAFVDDISPVVTDDSEGLLKQMYIEEFQAVPKCDRPTFEEWKENRK